MVPDRRVGTSLVVAALTLGALGAALAHVESSAPPPVPGPAATTGSVAPVPPPPAHPMGPHHPPRNLKLVQGHWTPYDPPEVPQGARVHVIVSGDTLWDLSAKYQGNPWLWPQLWDNNRYITDSHWIYPGDPILIPSPPTVVPRGEIPVASVPEEPVQEEPAPPAPPQPVALADHTDLYCSGYIDASWQQPEMGISALEEWARVVHGEGDVVYVNRGREHGVATGDEFDIVRAEQIVMDPRTEESLGRFVSRRGRIRVIATQPRTATAEITHSCIDIEKGDQLLPRWDPEVPMGFPPPPLMRHGSEPSGKAHGLVVASPDDSLAMGQGHVIQVSLGTEAGLRPGARVAIFRPHELGEDFERKLLGAGLVVTSRPTTAAVKVTESFREIFIGDEVEIQ